MKICYIAGSTIPSRTANSVHVMKMCQAYAKQGHEVTLVIPNHTDAVEPNVADVYEYYGVESNFKILKVGMFRPLKFWYAIVLTFRAIRATKADIYHSRMVWSGWALTTLYRKPTIVEMHEIPTPDSLLEKCFRATTRRATLKSVVAITASLTRCLSHLVAESARVVVAPDGVDQQLVDSPLSQQQARSDLDLHPGQRLLTVYSGHLYPGRGIEVVVEMARRHPDILFVVIGGREEDIADWRAKTPDIDNLTFAGFVAPREVFGFLRAADILLMPYAHSVSHVGGGDTASICSPMKMFEYLAAGRAIIASDLPVLQEVLKPDSNCLIAPYDRMDAWSQQMDRLKENADLRHRLGQQAREDVAGYTWESRSRMILEASGIGET